MIKKTILFASLVLALPASAFVSSAGPAVVRTGASSLVVQYAKNGTPLAVGQRSIAAGATSGEALIRDMLNAAGPAGNLPLTVSRTVTAAQVAAGLARAAGRANLPIAVGTAAYELLSASGVRQGASGAEIDPGADPVETQKLEWTCHTGSQYISKSTSLPGCAEQVIVKLQANADSKLNPAPLWSGNQTRTVYTYSLNSCASSSCWIKSTQQTQERFCSSGVCAAWKNTGPLTTIDSNLLEASSKIFTDKSCASIIDPLTGQSYIPGQYSDGKCMTASYSPATETQVQQKVLPAVSSDVAAAVRAALDAGAEIESSPLSISGPQTQTSAPSVSTKTSPAGTVTSTTTNNYQYNYAGDTINYTVNQTTVTQTTAPDGTTETTTETSDKTPEKTNCELYPKSIGCMELGEPEDSEIPEREEELELSPEDVALPSGCPSDLALPGGRVISYASACDAAQKMRPLVIAAGVLSALLIAVAAIRGHG